MNPANDLFYAIGEYALWANQVTFEKITILSDEEYAQDLGYGGSIKKIMTHLAEDTWGWYHGVLDQSPEKPEFLKMSKTECGEFVQNYLRKWIDLQDNKPHNIMEDEIEGKTVEFYFEEFVFNIFNHMTYHRGQLALALRMLGKKVNFTDYVPYRFNKEHGIV
ncbi:MAG: DinB family protein, partial [Candidatus Kariarchaeaceae archaeon]